MPTPSIAHHNSLFFKTLIEKSADFIGITDGDGFICYQNPAFCLAMGYTFEEVVGVHISTLIHPQDAARIGLMIETLKKNPAKNIKARGQLKKKNGEFITVEGILCNLLDDESIGGVVITSRDVSEQVALENQLRQNEQMLLDAQDLGNIGSWTLDFETRQRIWSPQMFKIFGLEPEDILKPNFNDMVEATIDPDYLHEYQSRVEKTRQLGSYTHQMKIVRPDGEKVFLKVNQKIIKDTHGTPIGLEGITVDVTMLQLVQDRIEQQKLFYENILNGIPIDVVVKDEQHRYVYVNPSAVKSAEERAWIIGKTDFEYAKRKGYAESVVQNRRQKAQEALHSNKALKWEESFKKTTLIRYIQPFSDEISQRKLIMGSAVDISELKHAQQQLETSNAYLNSIFNSTQQSIFAVDLEFNYLFFNANHQLGMEKFYKKNIEIGQSILKYVSNKSHMLEIKKAIDRASKGEIVNFIDQCFEHKTQTLIVDMSFNPIRNSNGETIGVAIFAQNVVQRYVNEQKIAEQKIQMQTAEKLILLGHWRNDFTKTPLQTQWSEGGYTILGFDPKTHQVQPKDYQNSIHPNDRERVKQIIDIEILQNKKTPLTYEHQMIQNNTKKVIDVEVLVNLILNQSNEVVASFGTILDITRIKQSQEQIKTLNNDLKQQINALEKANISLKQKNNFLDNFVFTVAHDLRSPVANLQALTKLYEIAPELIVQTGLSKITQSTERLDRTLRGLIKMIENQQDNEAPSQPTHIDFEQLISDIMQEFSVENQNALHTNLLCKSIYHIEPQIRSIFFNLIHNAVKYQNYNRQLYINVTTQQISPKKIGITIEDNGIGIDTEKYKNDLFKPFKRFTNQREGTGIGLSIIKNTIETNGGTLQLDSQLDTGTTFTITLQEYSQIEATNQ